jgi:hypothetical protein
MKDKHQCNVLRSIALVLAIGVAVGAFFDFVKS